MLTGMEDIPLVTWLIFIAIISLAGLVHGTLGLGFPLVAMPLLALFLDVRSAILLTLLPTVAVNIASILYGGNWRHSVGQFWPMGIYALAGSLVGASLIVANDPAPFKLLLAALVLVYLGSGWIGGSRMQWVSQYQAWSMLVFGLAAGVAAGATNVMVPILVIYALELGLAATAMVQVFNMCFLAAKLGQIALFTGAGLFGAEMLIYTLPLAGVALIALVFGMKFRQRISAEFYRKVIKRGLLVVALLLIGQFAVQ